MYVMGLEPTPVFRWRAMAETAINFGLMSYQSRSKPWNASRLVNFYPEVAPQQASSKTPVALIPTPGLALFSSVGDGPIRGIKEFLGVLYVVSGNSLYSIDEGGTATELGTISGVGYVTMDNNTTQLCIVSRPTGWIYTPATGVLAQITDVDFPGSGGVTQVGGYFIHMSPDNSGEWFLSDLDDGLAYDALDFATAEQRSDPLVRPFGDQQEVHLFGKATLEVWSNTGAADFPFSRVTTVEKGLLAALSVTKCDNTIMWVANDKMVYRLEGYTPRRISTHAIETLISETPDPSDIIGLSHVENGHSFYVITSMSGDWTVAYDAATGLWADRASYPNNLWRATTVAECYGKTLVGDSSLGQVYELQTGTYTDNAGTFARKIVSAPVYNAGNLLTMGKLEVVIETGVGLSTGQGSDPQVMLRFSDDGGRTWSNEKWRSLGAIGAYKTRAVWNRLGQFRERVFELTISDPVKSIVMGAYADLS